MIDDETVCSVFNYRTIGGPTNECSHRFLRPLLDHYRTRRHREERRKETVANKSTMPSSDSSVGGGGGNREGKEFSLSLSDGSCGVCVTLYKCVARIVYFRLFLVLPAAR